MAPTLISREVPSKFHNELGGCVDVVRVDKKHGLVAEIGYAMGTPVFGDND